MIHFDGLKFDYSERKKLFNNLKLDLVPGRIYGLLGKNGSGKTTLLKLVAGIVSPDSGDCRVMSASPKERSLGFLQEVYFLAESLTLHALTADQYVKLYAPFYPRFDREMFDRCMREFNLSQDVLLTSLSHGQKRKFSIVFGISTRCRLLILDEPTNGLDIPSKAEFRKMLASTMSDDQLIIISTHQVHDVENSIDAIVILEEGEIIFNQSIFDTVKKLAFQVSTAEPSNSEVIYSEKRLGGYLSVVENKSGLETQVDLELLFNAVVSHKSAIHLIFSGE